MTQQAEQYTQGDEISLVEVAAILIRRKLFVIGGFFAGLVVAIALILLLPDKYEYISLVKVAQVDSDKFIEPTASTVASLQEHWLPEASARYREVERKKLPFEVRFVNPKGTGLIRMISEASPGHAEHVRDLHEQLADRLTASQVDAVDALRESLRRMIENTDEAISALSSSGDQSGALAGMYEKRLNLVDRLESSAPPRTLVVARPSDDPAGPKLHTVTVFAAIAALILGILLALFVEFSARVRVRLEADQHR